MDIEQIIYKNNKILLQKNIKPLLDKILSIKELECDVELEDIIKISLKNTKLLDDFKNHILDLALRLRPWRKGPFELFDIFIDSEWQSFVKFNILKPHLNLENKTVCDVGCNNGYYMFKFSKLNPKKIVGLDPGVMPFLQFKFLDRFIKSDIRYELLGVQHLPFLKMKFDTVFCLGVIYHRSDPIKMLKEIKSSLNPKGELFLDTMFIDRDDEFVLSPKNTYSKIPNIYFVPTIKALQNWCERAKFKEFEILATKTTDPFEQRKTEWIYGESLSEFLDPNDSSKTIEGYPAPKRVYIRVSV